MGLRGTGSAIAPKRRLHKAVVQFITLIINLIYRALFILVPKSQSERCGSETFQHNSSESLWALSSQTFILHLAIIITSFFLWSLCCLYCFLAGSHLLFSSFLTPPFVFSFLLVDFAGGYGAEVPPKLGQSAAGASFMLCSLNLHWTI